MRLIALLLGAAAEQAKQANIQRFLRHDEGG
jgi:hypothetical protein